MDMRVVFEFLVPGVQHAEEANVSSEVFWITSDFAQRLGAGAEQQSVDNALVLQCQWGEKMREGEDDVGVAGGQQFLLAICQPTLTCVALALWAMPVSARVVRDGAISAVGAVVDMAAERSRAATFDGGQYLPVA